MITRRAVLAGGATLVASPFVSSAFGQSDTIRFATWGGGEDKLYEACWIDDFNKQAGGGVQVFDVAQPHEQIRADGANPQYHAVTLNQVDIVGMARDGYLQELNPADYPELANVDEKYWPTVDGKLYGLPSYSSCYGIAVNTKHASDTEFESWTSLCDPKWQGKIAVRTPVRAAQLDMTVISVAYGNKPEEYLKSVDQFTQYIKNARLAYTTMSQMNQLLMQGGITAGPFYADRIVEIRKNGVKDVVFVPPKEGCLAGLYGIVVPKNIELTDKLKSLLNYMSSAEPQMRAFDYSTCIPINRKASIDVGKFREALGYTNPDLTLNLITPDNTALAEQLQERTNLAEKIYAGIL